MATKKLKLVTSNKKKLHEFNRLGLDAEMMSLGADLKEILSTPEEVCIYKSQMAGPDTICKDTSLDIDGETVGVEIRWLLDNLPDYHGKKCVFRTILATNDGQTISLYEGIVTGKIDGTREIKEDDFGFDTWIIPDESEGKSLADLNRENKKDEFSARANAVHNYKNNQVLKSINIENISEWNGPWQNNG